MKKPKHKTPAYRGKKQQQKQNEKNHEIERAKQIALDIGLRANLDTGCNNCTLGLAGLFLVLGLQDGKDCLMIITTIRCHKQQSSEQAIQIHLRILLS